MDGTSASYVTIGGRQIWVETRGESGTPILLLHGGLGNNDEMLVPLGAALAKNHRLLAFDRRGHGRTPDDGTAFHYDDMVDETIAVIEHFGLGPVDMVGWSDGGIIALLLALKRPDLARRLVPIGANYHHNGVVGAGDPSAVSQSASASEREVAPSVRERIVRMWLTEPTLKADDLKAIAHPVLVMAGDRDMITPEHTVSMFEALPAGQLAIVPGTTHGVIAEKPDLVARLVLDFVDA